MNYVNIKIHIYSMRVENKFYSQTVDMKEKCVTIYICITLQTSFITILNKIYY